LAFIDIEIGIGIEIEAFKDDTDRDTDPGDRTTQNSDSRFLARETGPSSGGGHELLAMCRRQHAALF
jgi:hypothetical protein